VHFEKYSLNNSGLIAEEKVEGAGETIGQKVGENIDKAKEKGQEIRERIFKK